MWEEDEKRLEEREEDDGMKEGEEVAGERSSAVRAEKMTGTRQKREEDGKGGLVPDL